MTSRSQKSAPGALNYKGKESEQSKTRRGVKRKVDELAGPNSLLDKLKKRRKKTEGL